LTGGRFPCQGVGCTLPPPASLPAAFRLNDLRIARSGIDQCNFLVLFPRNVERDLVADENRRDLRWFLAGSRSSVNVLAAFRRGPGGGWPDRRRVKTGGMLRAPSAGSTQANRLIGLPLGTALGAQALLRTPPPSGLASSSDGAFEVVLALWSLLRLSLRRRILSGELRARFRPISRRFDFGRTQRSYTSPWLICRRRTQIFWIALWHEFV
jgi:hypothetical protein